jgi:quercetin dioxygenase-like cupin family protein
VRHYKLQEIPEEQVAEKFARRFFTGRNITLAFLSFKPGFAVPEHHHESEQFSYIVTGSMRFVIGGEEMVVRAGEVVHIPPNVPHSAVALEETTGIDVFSPIRQDWVDGSDDYLRQK